MTADARGEVHARLRSWVESWQRRRRSQRELESMNADVMRQVANDLGVGVRELSVLANGHDGKSPLLLERLDQLGLDAESLRLCDPALFRDLERVCSRCRSDRRCRNDLAHDDVENGMRDYCPNAQTMDALIAGRGT